MNFPHPQEAPQLFDQSYQEDEETGGGNPLLWAIVGLGVVGLCVSAYLTWTTWGSTAVVGCDAGGAVDCEEVLASHWSKWFGIPVSLLGLLTYSGMLAAAVMLLKGSRGVGATVLLTLSLLAAGSAAWFVGLQIFIIESFCLYCMGVHLCSLAIAGLTVYMLWTSADTGSSAPMGALLGEPAYTSDDHDELVSSLSPRPILASSVAAGGLAILMIGQYFFQPAGMEFVKFEDALAEQEAEKDIEDEPTVDSSESDLASLESDSDDTPESEPDDNTSDLFTEASPSDAEAAPPAPESSRRTESRLIKFGGLQDPIDVANVPILGQPDAEHVLLEMLDYTCPHCRNMHPHIESAVERYGDQVAFVVFHVPLSKKCNPYVRREHWSHRYACDYARLALSIFRLDPTKFAEFHSWVMNSKRPPAVVDARRFAMKLVGEDVLLDQNLKAKSLSSFAGNSDDLKKMNSGLPLIMTEKGLLKGVPRNETEFFQYLEKLLGVEPVAEL